MRNRVVRHHAEGLMALLQETTGKPVQFVFEREGHYDPQPLSAGGQVLVQFFQNIDPTIAATTLASIVKAARREYAGKPMRFGDFLPLYGAGPIGVDGSADLGFGYHLDRFEPSIPIYFPN